MSQTIAEPSHIKGYREKLSFDKLQLSIHQSKKFRINSNFDIALPTCTVKATACFSQEMKLVQYFYIEVLILFNFKKPEIVLSKISKLF